MSVSRIFVSVLAVGLMVPDAGRVTAADYPNRPVRVVTSESGSSLDFLARIVAQGLTASLGQQVIVDNRPRLTVEIVAKAQPDGYTLLAYGNSMWLVPFLQDNLTYDPIRDFAPISMVVRSPNVLVTNLKLPVNSVKELIALAKAKPGALNYGSSVTGGSPHLAAELFKAMAGVDIVRVPYKGVAPALTDVIAGQVQLMFPATGSGIPHAKAGRLKALAVTSAQTWPLSPELPTVAAAGLPGYESVAMQGYLAPGKTPAVLVARLQRDIAQYLSRPEVKEKFYNGGSETVGNTPAQFAATIKADMARMGKVIKDAGIRGD
jgi:tripartite-type tricarboxylate transporter receptor subunit TctC